MTKRTLIQIGLFATAALLVVAAGGQDSALVKLKFAKDTSLKYKTTTAMKMDVMGQTMDMGMEMTQSMSVLSQKDGWTTLKVVTDDMKATGEGAADVGSALEGAKGIVMQLEVDELGNTRAIALQGKDNVDPMTIQMVEGSMRAAQAVGFMGFNFPKDGITVGTKWNLELDAAKMIPKNEMISSVTGKFPVAFEVIGFEDLEGKRHAKIKTTITGTATMGLGGPVGDMTMTMTMQSTGTSWVDVATGFLTKSESVAQNDSDFGMGTMSQQISTKINRLP